MPRTVTATALRSRLFTPPPTLRTAAYSRTFSASSSCRSGNEGAIFESVLSRDMLSNQIILDTLHNSGLPWAAAIPVTAILVRMVILHWPAKNQQKLNNVSRRLIPLLRARGDLHAAEGKKQNSGRGREYSKRESRIAFMIRNAIKTPMRSIIYDVKSRRQLRQVLGLPRYQWYGLLNFGVLVYFSEVLRVKCGMSAGLISTGLSPIYKVWAWLRYGGSPPVSDAFVTTTTAAAPASPISNTFNEIIDGTPFLPSADVIKAPDSISTASLSDPSMHLEGLPWITDLAISDPTFILPMMMSASMMLPVILEARANTSQKRTTALTSSAMENKGKWVDLNFFQRIRISIGFLMFFISMNWPSGVVLYVATSMAAGAFHRGLLKRMIAPPPLISPCKRPIRSKIKSRWSEI
ncbi:hypothetical protein K431DRAFT_284015 [Polychaeton citri CBS 116435]|uniref:Uncharacterized protein n=1 Tax=Polychaeton citri CBS 116435 TaxID=1314669 RepID=A0A9P4UQ06_9PEZI|nr:hypothetical protein K431DRAFT_284015 [Polychaeton citri CBS 116435]